MARPRRRFAQHFLEPQWVTKVLDAIDLRATDRVIEIGPGRGALTHRLAERVARVSAIEIDRTLAAQLTAHGPSNLSVITADVLTVDLEQVARELTPPARVVGNLPYNISSPILFKLLDTSSRGVFTDATLMLQHEVAERLVAPLGTRDYGVLTMCTALWADVRVVLRLPPGAFRPMPTVQSAVVRLTFRPPPVEVENPGGLVRVVRSVFTQRRKTVANAIAPLAGQLGVDAREWLGRAGVNPALRPERLALADFAHLARVADELA